MMPDATTLTWEAKMTQITHSYNNGKIKNLIILEPERAISSTAWLLPIESISPIFQHFRQKFVHGNRPQLFECGCPN